MQTRSTRNKEYLCVLKTSSWTLDYYWFSATDICFSYLCLSTRQKVEELLANGKAYYCFCSDRRLDILRKDALRRREVPKYDNRCRHLSNEEVHSNLEKGSPRCVRFKVNEFESCFLHAYFYSSIVVFCLVNLVFRTLYGSDFRRTYSRCVAV